MLSSGSDDLLLLRGGRVGAAQSLDETDQTVTITLLGRRNLYGQRESSFRRLTYFDINLVSRGNNPRVSVPDDLGIFGLRHDGA